MTIYISHSRGLDYTQELYEPILNSDLAKNHTFIFPHAESEKPFQSRELFESSVCNLVIAEVSYPSTGQGIELGWASVLGVPIVCIYKEGAKISESLQRVTTKLLMYTDAQNMIQDITGALQQYV